MIEQQFTPDFLIIPKETMKLPPADRFVFGAVYWYTRLSLGKCIASNVELGRICGIKPHSITASLDRLEEAKLIIRTYKDEKKRHRDQIICLVGFGKLESSGMIVQSPQVKTLESSTEGHIKNTTKNNNTLQSQIATQVSFNPKDYFKVLEEDKWAGNRVIGYYANRKELWRNCPSLAAAETIRKRLLRTASDLSKFPKGRILQIMDELDELIRTNKIQQWGLESVARNLLK